MYNEENEHFFKSPIAMKGSVEQRFCFTESKVPFKDATNGTNLALGYPANGLPQCPFTTDKKAAYSQQYPLLVATASKS
jgi:hypothetical protein